MEEMTTIQVSKNTKGKLDKLKVHKREPYEDVIKSLLKVEETTRKIRQ